MSLKLLKESKFMLKSSKGWGWMYVSEYATTWRVTYHILGWYMPSILEERVKKVKGDTDYSVAQSVLTDAEKRNVL